MNEKLATDGDLEGLMDGNPATGRANEKSPTKARDVAGLFWKCMRLSVLFHTLKFILNFLVSGAALGHPPSMVWVSWETLHNNSELTAFSAFALARRGRSNAHRRGPIGLMARAG